MGIEPTNTASVSLLSLKEVSQNAAWPNINKSPHYEYTKTANKRKKATQEIGSLITSRKRVFRKSQRELFYCQAHQNQLQPSRSSLVVDICEELRLRRFQLLS